MKKSSLITVLFLTLILIVALFLRTFKLAENPPSLDWDEAAVGYNAYSLVQTGKDEYGTRLPLVFQSFNDYKLPGIFYTTAVFVKLFGLNDFIVRLPSALFGGLTVLIAFFLAKEVFQKYKNGNLIASVSALLLAISPWHIQFSRVAFEGNFTVFFISLAILFLIRGLNNGKLFLLSSLFFSLSFYFYHSPKIFVPIFLSLFAIVFYKQLKDKLRWIVASAILGTLLMLPLFINLAKDSNRARFKVLSLFNNPQLVLDYNQEKTEGLQNPIINKLVHNKYIYFGRIIINNYLHHFTPEFLFISGDANPRHGPRRMGMLYLWESVFLLYGLYLIIKSKKTLPKVLLLWLFSAPWVAAFSLPVPHSLRSEIILPSFQLITAFGLISAIFNTKKINKLAKGFTMLVIFSFALLNFIEYQDEYWHHSYLQTSLDWGYPYKQTALWIKNHQKDYNQFVITGEYWQPYIYLLYYLKIDPVLYQQNPNHAGFSKMYFTKTSWDGDPYYHQDYNLEDIENKPGTIIIDKQSPDMAVNLLNTIYDLEDKTSLMIWQVK